MTWQIDSTIDGQPLDKDGGMNRELFGNWYKKITNWREVNKKFGIRIKNVSKDVHFTKEAKRMYQRDILAKGTGYLEGDDDDAFDDNHLPEVDV
jgi:hypothetical protein